MSSLREYDVVRVVQLLSTNREFDGTEGVKRAPRIGDTATIVHQYEPENPTAAVVAESVDGNGNTIWVADFQPDELERVSRPGR